MKPTLLILAAGMGSRYGGLKQLDPMGPSGEPVMDYSVFDAIRAGFGKVVFVIRRDFEDAFRKDVVSRFEDKIQVELAFQDLNDLPEGFSVPEGREKPWGTAHAVLAARDLINEPFAMINADDFYGAEAYETIAKDLMTEVDESKFAHYSMVGFELKKTLSDHGSVARGVCRADDSGHLVSVEEMTKIVKLPDGGAENQENPDAPVALTGEELVSMNFWGFRPSFFDHLKDAFVEFLKKSGKELKSESYVPMVVDDLIRAGEAEVNVLRSASTWFGVTYQEDKSHVQGSIRALVESGKYPANLWA